jgi:hypothetical protein
MIQVHGKDRVRKYLVGAADQAFQHQLVGVGTGALADLDDERGLAVEVAAEQAHGLFQVVDVVGADSEFAVSSFKQLFGGNDHNQAPLILIGSEFSDQDRLTSAAFFWMVSNFLKYN